MANNIRNLNTKYPKRTIKYVKGVHDLFTISNLFYKLNNIRKEAERKQKWLPHMQKKFNRLDKEATNSLLGVTVK